MPTESPQNGLRPDLQPAEQRIIGDLVQRIHRLDVPISSIPVLSSTPSDQSDKPRPAAVLIPIHFYSTPSILLTVRSHKLQHHPGQIAFPGGAAESNDGGPAATAIREAWEEVGMPESNVIPLGYLDRLDTVSGYRVVPVIAAVRNDYHIKVDPDEVETVFYLPLAKAMDKTAYCFEQREYKGKRWRLPVLQHDDWRIWGATAIMLWRLCNSSCIPATP